MSDRGEENSEPIRRIEQEISLVARRIEDWKSRLIDLTRRNNLLYFRHTKRASLTVSSPDAETIFKRLVLRGGRWEFWLPPEGSKETPSELPRIIANKLLCNGLDRVVLERILKNLLRRSSSDFRERGIRILHMAFGMLVWKDLETKEEVRSPLILVPVELSRKSIREPFSISVPPVEEDIILNPALQVMLKSDFKLELPPLAEEFEGQSLIDYFNDVAEIVKDLGWKVEKTIEIGLFSFYKQVIYNDLETNARIISQHPIICKIAGDNSIRLLSEPLPDEKDVDNIETPEKTFQVLDADSSQRVCIYSALMGQSFVMQGPPGTGKSQTIANIIGECIAHGKSVLFVSDKMAALEVVSKRLTEVGLDHFCLELHSHKANKQEVIAELKRCIDEQLVVKKLPSPHEFEKMISLRNRLNGYIKSLHQERAPLGKTVYNVLDELSVLENVPFVPMGLLNARRLTWNDFRELEDLISKLRSVWQVVEEADFPWRGYVGSKYDIGVRSELTKSLDDLIATIDSFISESDRYSKLLGLERSSNLYQVKWLIEVSDFIKENPRPELKWVISPKINELISDAKSLCEKCSWCIGVRSSLLKRYGDYIFKLPMDRSKEIEGALADLSKLLNDTDLYRSDFLVKQTRLLQFVKDSEKLTEEWTGKATTLARILGVSTENHTVGTIRKLIRIVSLCYSAEKIEETWLEQSNLLHLKKVLPKIKTDYKEYNTLKKRLAETYNDSFYDLDLRELAIKYKGIYRSISRLFIPNYRHDQMEIAKTTRRGRVPSTLVNDLTDTMRLKELKSDIEQQTGAVKNLLGHFYHGYDTDFERVENAITVASEVSELLESLPPSEQLLKLISQGPISQPMLKHDAESLGADMEKWYQETHELTPFAPVDRMPNSGLPLVQTPLTLVREWTKVTEKQLSSLLELQKEILEACKNERLQNFEQLLRDIRDAEDVRINERWIEENDVLLREKIGSRFSGLNTDWTETIRALEWTKKLKEFFDSHVIPQEFAENVSLGADTIPSNQTLVERFGATLKKITMLEAHFESPLTYQGGALRELSFEEIRDRLSAIRKRVDDLQLWVDFKEAKNRFSEKSLGGFLDRLTVNPPPVSSQLMDIFRKSVYEEWLNSVYDEDENLGRFRRENHEQLISEFQNLDRELIQLTPSRVIKIADSRRPHEVWVQANNSEISVLLKEAAKKRRRMPIRQLFKMMPNLLSILKPCLLMSPLSVSQFLSSTLMQFDLVLFDEASQIVPEDAIGAIYRGKAVVVAGDSKQLPPTSFFQKTLIDDYDWDDVGEDIEIYDSILDECLGIGLPIKTLRWHYRSNHEDLITFSNQHFYDGSLITFPSALSDYEGLGIKLVNVPDGVYDRGGRRDNIKEAEIIANLAIDHFKKSPDKTLGVVTFSIAQMEAVEDAIEHSLDEYPDLERFFKEDRLQGFFVKNLENVQGDERDVIILSVGYGRDDKGQMTMNFGPLNKPGGERRLNVAITRARENVIIVSSIKSDDIQRASTTAAGVLALHDYLKYAEQRHDSERTTYSQTNGFESAIEKEVASEIKLMGYDAVNQVGCGGFRIDIGVIDPKVPGRFLLGIMFDGPTYRLANSARDRDRLREQVLKKLGWKIYRIWSPSWTARRGWETKRLKEAIEKARTTHQTEAKAERSSNNIEEASAIEVKQAGLSRVGEIGVPYTVSELKAKLIPYFRVKANRWHYNSKQNTGLNMPINRAEQCRLLTKLVREEGPIHFDYATKRLTKAIGYKRIRSGTVTAFKEAVLECERKGQLVVKGEFLWPPQLDDVPVRVPELNVPDSIRRIEYIPEEEIEKMMKLIVYHSVGISPESLLDETAHLFGFRHIGTQIRFRLFKVYSRMLKEGVLIYSSNVVTLSKD